MAREPVARYRVGETFTCVRRPVTEIGAELTFGEPCGAEITIHRFWWCAQVCPVCLANYHVGGGSMMELFLDTAGFYPPDTARRVRDAIARNGGQYVPEFR